MHWVFAALVGRKTHPLLFDNIMCKAGGMNIPKDEIVVLHGVTMGEKLKLTRIALHMRQLDLASAAKCNLKDVQNIEKDRFVLVYKSKIRAILTVLNIEIPEEFLPDDTGTLDEEGDTDSD